MLITRVNALKSVTISITRGPKRDVSGAHSNTQALMLGLQARMVPAHEEHTI